jgi:3-isopropylmalate/(R)-2-methylmalate dehydratase small subunit
MKAWVVGDNVDTDQIVPGRHLACGDTAELAKVIFEDVRPGMAAEVSAGDILVAGDNFGCGSSREQAAQALKAAGFAFVAAKSFARIFFRNCINIGLPVLVLEGDAGVREGDELLFDRSRGMLVNATAQAEYPTGPMPAFIQQLVSAGGIVAYACSSENKGSERSDGRTP